MDFGENVGYYRKKLGITQEELADRLYVSRQTVSRWETNSSFPDVETIIKLCELFECDMDTLVRGSAEQSKERPTPLDVYDKHMNRFSVAIALGVFLILLGVSTLLFSYVFSPGEIIGLVALFVSIAVAIADFIISGINHEEFVRENKNVPPYGKDRVKRFRKKFAVAIAGATMLIFAGIVALVLMCYKDGFAPLGFSREEWEYFSASVLLFCISISVFIYVFFGIQYSKYDVAQYNKDSESGAFEKASREEKNKVGEAVSSAIMLTATAVFLLLGFIGNLWHPGWVAFPIGGILCAISSIIMETLEKKK